MKNNEQLQDPFKKRRMRTYFQFSMIAVCIVAVVAVVLLFAGGSSTTTIDYSQSEFVQYEEPSDDAPVVVFETTEGTFKAVLFEEEAPEYCEYFQGLVNDGYFDDTYICTILRSEDGLTGGFIGGSKTLDGTASDDTDLTMPQIEVSGNLLPTKGTLGSLVKQSGKFTKAKAGSVFTVLGDVVDVDELNSNEADDVNGLEKVKSMFIKYGGVPNYLQMYTFFGQIYDGWDVVDAILSEEIVDEGVSDDEDDKNLQPVNEIKFTKVYMSTYGENKENGYVIPEKEQTTED